MPIVPYEQSLRRALVLWDDAHDQLLLRTNSITKLFGIPLGFHPFITAMFGRQTTGTNQEDLIAFIDAPRDIIGTVDAGEVQYTMSDGSGIDRVNGANPSKKIMWITNIGGNGNQDRDRAAYNCWNQILFTKSDGTWAIVIEYRLVPGAMRWDDEWAALLRQKRNIPKQTTAGSKFHQVGNYHVLRRYNLLS